MFDRLFDRLTNRVWGQANAIIRPFKRRWWIDGLVVLGLCTAIFGLVEMAREWTGELRPSVVIDLSPLALPVYTFYSMVRGLAAYAISLVFTLVYAYWAAKDSHAERLLVPLLDILQSIPVLGFMPGLVLALVALFPSSNVGLELAAVIMIFTGQAWNMTFSLYHSLKSVPQDVVEASRVYRFGWWSRFKWVELPFGATGLVWNSMMSMAGGWFFLMINEAFRLGQHDFRLPGLGSYMSVAVSAGRPEAMALAVAAMVLMIVGLDQLLWRPVVVWAQRFRVEETAGAEVSESWFLTLLRRSTLVAWLRRKRSRRRHVPSPAPSAAPAPAPAPRAFNVPTALPHAALAALVLLLVYGGARLAHLLSTLPAGRWAVLGLAAAATLSRVLLSTLIGTAWAVPVGLGIGLSARWSRLLQPVVQVMASFPAPMLFPVVIALLHFAGVGLGTGSIVLMLLGTQWYILFNVIAGASSMPSDLREAAVAFGMRRRERWWSLYLPAVFPFLVTGWVTAAGGAWNASIVAEYVTYKGASQSTFGLGAAVSEAAEHAQFAELAAAVLVMSLVVVSFNRLVWRRCYHLASTRFSLTR
ncbi:MAG TPA: ABC transporter permease subunit [Vicinamibacteria bacterium]|nr:ABC transporter permease subunit [Vicinamibacteria bacterium]